MSTQQEERPMMAPPDGTRTFHYVLTLQWLGTNRAAALNGDGTVYLRPGATRSQVLAHLRERLGAPEGFSGPGLVMFFSVEPDDLAVTP